MTRVRCEFLRSEVPSPCPRKTLEHGCVGCKDAILERSAIIECLGKVGRALADSLARDQAIQSMPGQMTIL